MQISTKSPIDFDLNICLTSPNKMIVLSITHSEIPILFVISLITSSQLLIFSKLRGRFVTTLCGCRLEDETREHSQHVTPSLWWINITEPQKSHFSIS